MIFISPDRFVALENPDETPALDFPPRQIRQEL